jgi:hypothetical protein
MMNDQPAQSLGPNHIEWCKRKIPSFGDAWRAVKKADEHSQKVKERLLEGVQT